MIEPNYAVRRPTRRQILWLGATAAAAIPTTIACDVLATEPDNGRRTPTAPTKGPEAPALAEKTASKHLPPVHMRLPQKPLVVESDTIGVYGGTWRACILGPTSGARLQRTVGYETLLRWKPDTRGHTLDEIIPNVAESYEINSDATEYTFHLREGLRWSDSEPFTADDVVFAVESVYLNQDLYPAPPLGLLSGDGGTASAEKIDTYIVKFTFTAPSGLLLYALASKNLGLYDIAAHPRHYLERFHVDYNPNVEDLLREEGAPDWIELFFRKSDIWNNTELPRLHPWIPTNPLNEGARIVFERNPYYWKVDTEGSQLPYLDSVVFEHQDEEVMLLRALAGEIDMEDSTFNSLQNKPVLAKGADDGDYQLYDLTNGVCNTAIISFNLTHKDPVKRQIFNTKDFRIGLSHAINREEIIATLYRSQGEPSQAAPLPESSFYNETLATQYLEYNVDLANEYLDRAGFAERDGKGIRLGPDGRPIKFRLEASTTDLGNDWASVIDLVKSYWREVGIEVHTSTMEESLAQEYIGANDHDAFVSDGDGGGLDPHLMPRAFMPYNIRSQFAYPWAEWYQSGGTVGASEKANAALRSVQIRGPSRRAVKAD